MKDSRFSIFDSRCAVPPRTAIFPSVRLPSKIQHPKSKIRSAFTLLEILLALALAGLVLTALNTFIFSMGELWGRGTDVRLFDQHVRAVTRFLTRELSTAALPPSARYGATPIVPQEVRPRSGLTENLVTFDLPEGSRLIQWPDRPLPEVVCSLQARDREGLFLLWQSRLEKRFGEDSPHEAVITPLCTALAYDYYDESFKNWKTETAVRKETDGTMKPPHRLRLKFTYGKLTRETVITLPVPSEALPDL